MGNNQMMLGVHGTLHIVPEHPAASVACGHRTRVGIGQRDLGALHRGSKNTPVSSWKITTVGFLPDPTRNEKPPAVSRRGCLIDLDQMIRTRSCVARESTTRGCSDPQLRKRRCHSCQR